MTSSTATVHAMAASFPSIAVPAPYIHEQNTRKQITQNNITVIQPLLNA